MALKTRPLGAEGALLLVVAVIVIGLSGAPLLLLARLGLVSEAGLSVAPLLDALGDRSVGRALWNSLESATLSALLATMLGALLAVALGLTDIRAKGPLVFLILLPMMIPPHVTAIAWIQAFGPSSPLLRALDLAPEIGTRHPLYSREGVIALLSVQHAPLAFLTLRVALRALPREMVDAARGCGAGGARVLTRIIAPLTAPALIAAFALCFVSALGNFGIPALLGIPARYTTLPVLIWRRMSSFGPSVLADVAVIAVLVGIVAVAALLLQSALQRRFRATLIGPPQPPLALKLGRWRPFAEAGLWALIAAVLVAPLVALMATALVKTYGLPLNAETATLENFREVLFRQSVTGRAFFNSTLLAAFAAMATAALAIGVGHYQSRARGGARRAAAALGGLADMAYAVPGIVVSIAFILAFIRPLPLVGFSLYGTVWIIALAYVAAFLSVALKPTVAAYGALDPALDEAARIAGAGFMRRLTRIAAPLVGPAAGAGGLLVFLTAYNEVTVSALLWSGGSETIGTTIFNYEDGGYTTLAAAMAAVTVAATAALMLMIDLLGRRLPPGVAPWRADD